MGYLCLILAEMYSIIGGNFVSVVIWGQFRLGNYQMKTFNSCGQPRRSKRLQNGLNKVTNPRVSSKNQLADESMGDTVHEVFNNSSSSHIYSGRYLVDYCYRNWSRWAREAREEAKRLRTLDPPCTLSGPAGEESVQMLADRLTQVSSFTYFIKTT